MPTDEPIVKSDVTSTTTNSLRNLACNEINAECVNFGVVNGLIQALQMTLARDGVLGIDDANEEDNDYGLGGIGYAAHHPVSRIRRARRAGGSAAVDTLLDVGRIQAEAQRAQAASTVAQNIDILYPEEERDGVRARVRAVLDETLTAVETTPLPFEET